MFFKYFYFVCLLLGVVGSVGDVGHWIGEQSPECASSDQRRFDYEETGRHSLACARARARSRQAQGTRALSCDFCVIVMCAVHTL